MAGTHNFKIFDEAMDPTTIDTDLEYEAEGQRYNGVTPGLATPKMHNKLYRQCSVMAYAIASVLAARGFNASDADSDGLINAIQRAFAFKVNNSVPNASGAITTGQPIDAWPVGSVFITLDNRNPSSILGGGNWVQIKGKYLIAADTGYTVDGNTNYGAMSKSVPLSAHTHSFSISSSGAHTHSVSNITTTAAGGHTHTISTNGDHYHGAMGEKSTYPSLYGFYNSSNNHPGTSGSDNDDAIWKTSTDGAHKHTATAVSDHTHKVSVSISSSGAHTHSGTTGSQGTSSPTMDMRPLSIAVYMWRRTA